MPADDVLARRMRGILPVLLLDEHAVQAWVCSIMVSLISFSRTRLPRRSRIGSDCDNFRALCVQK
jgi:hypothetical protein